MANPWRGEARLHIDGRDHILRPSFAALAAAEQELGSLFALVERGAAGGLMLSELVVLFWYCLNDRESLTRNQLGQAVMRQGLTGVAPQLRLLLGQILQGEA